MSMSYRLPYTSLIKPGVSTAKALASFATPGSSFGSGSQRQGQTQRPGPIQTQGRGETEVWINVEQKMNSPVQRAPLQYSTFVNQHQHTRDIGMNIDPFDTTTPLPDLVPVSTPASRNQIRPGRDIIKVHDSGVVLQLSEVSSEPAQSQSQPQKGQGQGQEQPQTNISDDWEVVYPDE